MRTIAFTYDIVTDESAASGDVSERGFIVDGYDIPVPDGLVGPDFVTWRAEYAPPVNILEMVDGDDDGHIGATVRLLREGGYTEENGDSFYQPDPHRDLYTGDERTEAAHLTGYTREDLDEISRRMYV